MDNRLLRFNEEEEEKLKRILRVEIEQARSQLSKKFTQWRKWNKAYEMRLHEERTPPWEGAANIDIGLVPALVDHLQKELLELIFNWTPLFFTYPAAIDYPPELGERASRWQNFLDILLCHKLKVRRSLAAWIHYALKYGVGWLKVIWKVEPGVSRPEIVSPAEEMPSSFSPEVGQPQVVALSPFDVIPLPPSISSLSSVWGIAHRETLRLHQLEARVREGKYLRERVEELVKTQAIPEESIRPDEVAPTTSEETFIKQWEVYEVICYNPFGEGEEREQKIVVDYAPQPDIILSYAPYPYLYIDFPYIDLQLIPREKSIFGISFVERIYNLAEMINTINNQRLDIFSLLLQPPILRSVSSSWDYENEPLGPNRVIDVNTPTDLQYFLPPNLIPPSVEIEQMLLSYLTRITGVAEARMGVPGRRMTATEVSALLAAIPRQMMHFLFEKLLELPRKIQALYRQYLMAPTAVVGVEPQGVPMFISAKLEPEDVEYDYVYAVHGSLQVPDVEKLQELIFLAYREMMQNPLVNQDPQRLYALSRMLLTSLRIRNYKEILGEEPQAQPQAPEESEEGVPPTEEGATEGMEAAVSGEGGGGMGTLLRELLQRGIRPMPTGAPEEMPLPEEEGGEEEWQI